MVNLDIVHRPPIWSTGGGPVLARHVREGTLSDFVSTQEMIVAARKNLEQGPWDYLVGASESETTMRRNRLGFDKIAFRPRVLVDVSSIDPSTTFLGHKLRIPVMPAPIGSLQVFHPGAGAEVTRGASRVRHHARAPLRHRADA